MPIIKVIDKNLLEADEEYVAHQCNCLTVTSHGLAKTIADIYPWADVYRCRQPSGTRNCAIEKDREKPGTIKIIESPKGEKKIICMFLERKQNT